MSNKITKGLKYLKIRWHEFRLCLLEFSKGSKFKGMTYEGYIDSGMLVGAHSVEKGLGLRVVQPGHSGEVVNNLLDRLISLVPFERRNMAFPFRETFRIIMAYMDFQMQYDTSKFALYPTLKKKYDALCDKLGSEYIDSVRAYLEAGSKYYTKTDLLPDETLDLESFFSSRHSIRTYLQEPVKEEIIREAVKIANRAPSACNRQASYVYFSNSKETVERIDSLITGSSGFKGEVPNYIIVTTDRAYFSDVEQFQWYINGGLYLSYLSLALHSQGIGHCIMQWKAFYKTEDDLKALMGISKSEAIIAVVGCGYYPEEVRCIDAQRKGVEDTLRIIQ